jgi:hypothetical protein
MAGKNSKRLVLIGKRIKGKTEITYNTEAFKKHLNERDRLNLELDIDFEKWAREQTPICLNYGNLINGNPTR